MPMLRLSSVVAIVVGLSSCLPVLRAGEPFRFPEAKHGKGELRYINGLPVLTLAGTPEEIGGQMRVLTRSACPYLVTYPMKFLKTKGPSRPDWATLVQLGKHMLVNFPPDQRREYESAIQGTLVRKSANARL